mgnify:CR=1 FL=1|jgi:uncharacterized protein (DUF302 family)
MIYTITTKTPLQTVKDELSLNAKEYGFGVLGSYDFKKILESKGFPIENDVTVFEVCNPKGGQDALINFPEISAFLPCRVSVYEDGENTALSTIDLSVILGGASDELRERLQSVYDNLLKLMRSL